jgi:uncharacterized protein (DUF58 family)
MNSRLRMRWTWPLRVTPPPLVDAHTIERLHRAANAGNAPALLAQREVQHLLLGERQSAFAGRGYEFSENRAYLPGDEARFINWRAFARSGQLYRKTFYEERRPQLWLLVDRGASMCFGTRVRLKLAQAAQLALFHLFLAQRRALATGAVLFDAAAPVWFAPSQDRASQQSLIQALCAPCSPPPETESASALTAILQQCLVQLVPGCIVIVYSDFRELQASDMPVLHALAQRHSVYARHILDASEIALPTQGEYHFARGDEVTALDCGDSELAQRYRRQMQERHQCIADWFRQAEIDYQAYRADDDLLAAE